MTTAPAPTVDIPDPGRCLITGCAWPLPGGDRASDAALRAHYRDAHTWSEFLDSLLTRDRVIGSLGTAVVELRRAVRLFLAGDRGACAAAVRVLEATEPAPPAGVGAT